MPATRAAMGGKVPDGCRRRSFPALLEQPGQNRRNLGMVAVTVADVRPPSLEGLSAVVDWGAGSYEITAAELAPVAQAMVQQARISASDDVVDVACGTGNAALLAAARGARVVGVDGAARLLQIARDRAQAQGLVLELREGDLLALPLDDAAADVVLSVFGVIFAQHPGAALREVRRIVRSSGRVLISAWIPAGPIDAMLSAMGRIIGRVSAAPPPPRFAWSDPEAVASVAAEAGFVLDSTTHAELPIRAASPEAYVLAGQQHPVALAVRPLVEQGGVGDEIREAMTAVLHEANEDPDALLVHSPYVVHELRPR
ncbi:MAG: class I SAM-dependent methyltransferase [Actinobacteria bacterium]|nr:class I SAM-dependent methyltransferase [Actinomycetota bacterium]